MPYTPLQLANAFLQTGELDDALDALNQHLAASPDDAEALRLRAQIKGRHDMESRRAALADLERLPDLSVEDVFLRLAILTSLDETEAAQATILEALAQFPQDERLAERGVDFLREIGKLTEARALVAQQPPSWRWHQWAGMLAAEDGDFAAAVEAYSGAIAELEHRYRFDLSAPARILDTGSDAAALTVVAAYGSLRLARGHALLRLNRLGEAEADYAAAAAILPNDETIRFYQGIIAALQGNLDEAERFCRVTLQGVNEALCAVLRDELSEASEREPALKALLQRLF
ncbi:MAG: tetratricopeptide repeat protein [bacterium]|nr:tetratricopeptide repeat protein [bacterium]